MSEHSRLLFVGCCVQAFEKWQSNNEQEPILPGLNLSHPQLFFVNFAQVLYGSTTARFAKERGYRSSTVEIRTRDQKVSGSSPCTSGGRMYLSRVSFLC